jgi:hypothetical protein
MKNERDKDNTVAQLVFEWKREKLIIQFEASKQTYIHLLNCLMPAIYGLVSAGVFFSSLHTSGNSPPVFPVASPQIEVPTTRQGESA